MSILLGDLAEQRGLETRVQLLVPDAAVHQCLV